MTSRHDPPTTLRIAPLAASHVPSLAAAHVRCFPGFFLTNLGERFLETYYGSYIATDTGFGIVALDEADRVVAFAVGTTELDDQDAILLRRHPWSVLRAVATRWFVTPEIRQQVYERSRRFLRLLGRIARPRPSRDAPAPAHAPFVTLTSVGAVPEVRGTGVAMQVVGAFAEEVRRRGYRSMRAATSIDNHRAVAFYERTGWRVESVREHENGVTFERFVDGTSST